MSAYARAISNFGSLIDDKVGIIQSVEIVKLLSKDPDIFLAYATPCNTVPITGIKAANRGAACATTLDRALVRACGESIERYCSAIFNVKELMLASETALTAQDVAFTKVSSVYPYADWQYREPGFPYELVSSSQPIRWVTGTSGRNGAIHMLPASCVYVPYIFDHAVEPFTHMPISTGLAAGQDLEICIQKGILEILERDALMVTWYNKLESARIDVASCLGYSAETDQLLGASTKCRASWHINLLTLDVDIPIISAALINSDNPPLTSFGIAADPDPLRALKLALEEAILTRMLLNRSEEIAGSENYVHTRLETLRDHLLAHATSPSLRSALRFLTHTPDTTLFSEIIKRFSAHNTSIAERLFLNDLDYFWVDVTTPDVQDLGFHVVRVVIPGMQPLDNDHRYRYLGGGRLYSIPLKRGYPIPSFNDFNSAPHPFP